MNDEHDRDLLMRRVAAYLAVVVVLGFLGLGVMLTFREIPAANKETFLQFTGALTLAFGGLMSYLFGRSANGDVKDRALAAAAVAAVPPPPPPPPPPGGAGGSALTDAAPTGTPGDPVSVTEVRP